MGGAPGLGCSVVTAATRECHARASEAEMPHLRYTRRMVDPAKRRATYEELLAVPKHLVAEIIHGTLITQPRPASRHARAASRLGAELDGPFDRAKGGPGGWLLLDAPELHLHGDILVPDLAGWRRERMPELPDAAAFELAPDWVCEVLSPSTAATDRAEKMPIYAREHVGYVWLVDPIAQTLEALRLDGGRWVLLGTWRDDAKVRAEPFESFELALEGLWAK
jgi:Uma2 family endonuclease